MSITRLLRCAKLNAARGHKFALTDIAKGANVIKYGLPIGYALADIAAGEHVHAHNTRTNLSDLDQYRYQPDFQDLPAQAADREVQIFIVALTAMSGCVMSC
ncbi:SAF domain-containing protein [Escherichia coli]